MEVAKPQNIWKDDISAFWITAAVLRKWLLVRVSSREINRNHVSIWHSFETPGGLGEPGKPAGLPAWKPWDPRPRSGWISREPHRPPARQDAGGQASVGSSWGRKLSAAEMEAKIKFKAELPRLPCSWLKQDPKRSPAAGCRAACAEGSPGAMGSRSTDSRTETSRQCHCGPPGPAESTSHLTDL